MIIDAHYHLEEELETLDTLLGEMQKNEVSKVALISRMNEPFHLKPIPRQAGKLLPVFLAGKLRGLGMALYNSTVTSDGQLSTLGVKYQLYHKPDNAYIDVILENHPDKFFGWVFVNPKTMDPIQEMEKWVGRPGWIGVKTHPFWHNYPVSSLDDAAALCRERDMPLLMHLGGDHETGDFRYLPERHPGLKIVYAHAGVPYYQEVWAYAKNIDGVFIDLSSSIYMNENILAGVIQTMGSRKCLYGTDGPYGYATQERMLNRIYRMKLPSTEQGLILGGNFLELISR